MTATTYRRGNFIFKAASDHAAEQVTVSRAYRGFPLSRLDGDRWTRISDPRPFTVAMLETAWRAELRDDRAENIGFRVAESLGIASGKGNRAVNCVLLALGRRGDYRRNNAGANYEAVAQLCDAKFGSNPFVITWSHSAPRDARLTTIPRGTR